MRAGFGPDCHHGRLVPIGIVVGTHECYLQRVDQNLAPRRWAPAERFCSAAVRELINFADDGAAVCIKSAGRIRGSQEDAARLSGASRRVLTKDLPAALATLPIHGQVLETVAAGSGAIPRRQTVGRPLWQHAHKWPTTNQDRKYRRIDRVASRPSLPHGAGPDLKG